MRTAREQAILDAALDLVIELGFDRVSMDAIAQRAQASKATIYRHWAGKPDLVVDAVRCRVCPEGMAPPPTGSLRGDLLATVALMSDGMTGPDGRLMLGLIMASQRDPDLATLLRTQLHEAKRPAWQGICERAVLAGELADVQVPTEALITVLPALAIHRHVLLGLTLDPAWQQQVIDDIVLPLLRAISPVAATFPV